MKKILQDIANFFDLGNLLGYTKIEEGALNENIKVVTDKGVYFVKGIRAKTKERLNYIHEVERYMLENGIPSVCMLQSQNGNYIYIGGETHYTVYPFVESDRSHVYSSTDLEKMGKLLGEIHKVSSLSVPDNLKKYPFRITSKENKTNVLNGYKDLIQSKVSRDEIDELFLSYIILKAKSLEKLNQIDFIESDTLIHGDYHAGNLLFGTTSREIIGVCDWEKAEYSPRAYELARSILYICFSLNYNEEQGFKDAKYFVNGYMQSFPISKELFIKGLQLRLRQTGLSTWLEDGYYKDGEAKNNKFIQNEIEHIKLFIFGDGIQRLESVF